MLFGILRLWKIGLQLKIADMSGDQASVKLRIVNTRFLERSHNDFSSFQLLLTVENFHQSRFHLHHMIASTCTCMWYDIPSWKRQWVEPDEFPRRTDSHTTPDTNEFNFCMYLCMPPSTFSQTDCHYRPTERGKQKRHGSIGPIQIERDTGHAIHIC